MCNFTALRNLLIACVAAIGWAVSSGWFSYGWSGTPIVGPICWSITGLAAVTASVLIMLAYSAATTYCACVSKLSACSTACASIGPALLAALAPVVALMITAAMGGADHEATLVLMFLITAAFAALSIYVASLAATLGACQAPPPKLPTPTGSGTGSGAAPGR